MKEKKVEERAAAPGMEKPDPAKAEKPEKTVKKEPEKKTAPTVQTAPTPKEPEKPQDAPRRGKMCIRDRNMRRSVESNRKTMKTKDLLPAKMAVGPFF